MEATSPSGIAERPSDSRLERRSLGSLALGLVFMLVIWARFPHTFEASDPWAYARRAHAITQGTYLERAGDHPFDQRIGVSFPVAAVYATLGVTPRSTHTVPLLAGLLLLAWVWVVLPDARSRGFGVLLAATSVPLLEATAHLFPDLIATVPMLASLTLLWRRSELAGRPEGLWYGALAAAIWMLAFLAKETAVWALPVFAVCAGLDLAARRGDLLRRFHVPAVACGAVLGAAYLGGSALAYGNPFARFSGIERLADGHLWSRGGPPVVARLLDEPFAFFEGELGTVCVLALLSVLVLPRQLRFWAYLGGFFVLMLWLGSASLTAYRPLPLFPRMALPALGPLLVIGGFFAAWLTRRSTHRLALPIGLAIVGLLTFHPVRTFVASWVKDPEQKALRDLREELAKQPGQSALLVTADSRSAEFVPIYFGFRIPENLVVTSAQDVTDAEIAGADVVFLYIHSSRSAFLARAYGLPSHDRALRAVKAPRIFGENFAELFRAARPFAFHAADLRAADGPAS